MLFLFWIIDYVKSNKASAAAFVVFSISLAFSKYNVVSGKKIKRDHSNPVLIGNAMLEDLDLKYGYILCSKDNLKIAVFLSDVKLPRANSGQKIGISSGAKVLFNEKLKGRYVMISGYEPKAYYRGSADLVVEGDILLADAGRMSISSFFKSNDFIS